MTDVVRIEAWPQHNVRLGVATRVETGAWQSVCDAQGRPIDLADITGPGWRPEFRTVEAALKHFARVRQIFARSGGGI